MELKAVSRVLILFNPVEVGDDPSTLDILSDIDWVASGLVALGIPYEALAVPGWTPWRNVTAEPGTLAFNLFESPPAVPSAHSSAAAAMELMQLPFTGSPAAALWLTTDKLATRALLASEGLPVAPGGRLDPDRPELLDRIPGPWILKPSCEDASLGLEGDPVCATRDTAVARAQHLQARFPNEAILAERYLPGRELNVSLLAREGGVDVLPVAEIVFEGYPEGMARVVSYEAKWQQGSFAYAHTRRHFPEDPADGPLLQKVREISVAAWKICGLRGYARVDIRLDERGEPHVLEVNANPSLAADAGFVAATQKAGLAAREAVGRIVEDAVRGRLAMEPPRNGRS